MASEKAREVAWMVGEVSRYPVACERGRAGTVSHREGSELVPEKRRRTMTGKESRKARARHSDERDNSDERHDWEERYDSDERLNLEEQRLG